MRPRPSPARSHEDETDVESTILGVGQAHSIREDNEPPQPGIWLPDHPSGSRFGGWHRRPVSMRRPIGFQRP